MEMVYSKMQVMSSNDTPLPRFFNHPEVVIVNLKPKM